ncbi:MAG TPA: TrmH family RNA methyltransferase [Pseudonocardiaceae bacterium]|nr:TrmH family RNA methyltransferase [Pseudonocardiaceae bacterium]
MSIRPDLRISSRNARFQQWRALLDNRTKRTRSKQFLVHGVRPITVAHERDWPLAALLYPADRPLSGWARDLLADTSAERVAMAPELLAELAERPDEAPELVAVAAQPADELDRIAVSADFLGVLFDRPTNPGNVGTVVRSADAFGAAGVIITGHAADPYDPRSVRASTGSLFALPVVRAAGPEPVIDWARRAGVRLVGTDEHGSAPVSEYDLTGPTLLVLGNETNGMAAAWREACAAVLRIPIGGSASSLNAASAATVVLYETARQRGIRDGGIGHLSPNLS